MTPKCTTFRLENEIVFLPMGFEIMVTINNFYGHAGDAVILGLKGSLSAYKVCKFELTKRLNNCILGFNASFGL